jgi:hypothetical protein
MGEAAPTQPNIEAFITRWTAREGGAERANYGMFLTELCDLIGVEHPDPAGADTERNDYVFERAVRFHSEDDKTSVGRIDLYKKGAFVLEAKQSRIKGGKKEVAGQDDLFSADAPDESRGRRGADRAWDVLMLNAKRQAEDYARALPIAHGWPPFVLVCDVGHCVEVYADFSGQGKNYTQFPDRQGFRVFMDDLRKEDVRERLKLIWTEPQALDPTRKAAKATRDIAERLAQVSKALEAKNYPPEQVAHFLMRCLFTMFAASVKLLPEDSFRDLLGDCRREPDKFVPLVSDLWRSMNSGAFAASIRAQVLQFNGNLFAEATVLPLGREEIGELYEAAQKDWHEVEPAIFGTLLEQALDPAERRRLGAHYTPRAYVERLVVATIIEPLREDWRNVQAAAETRRAAGDKNGAADAVKAFHDKLSETRVLDPACGTGNFLYVSMELMKRLEGEVLEALLDLGGQEALRGLGGHTVDPHQFLGLEINPRAAAIAELVLWIGYLQWHFRTRGGTPEQPILRQFKNIEVKNAVLTWDGYPAPQTIEGEEAYPNPKRPTWPTAEFIVGNPPFLGNKRLREILGEAYVDALHAANPQVNESADFVMYWWDIAAGIVTRKGSLLRRFGLVTTNSISQVFNRRVLTKYLDDKAPVSIVMAIADHPWTKATKDAAAVRIAMTVAESGKSVGLLRTIKSETDLDSDQPVVEFEDSVGTINADLSIGANVATTASLRGNQGICQQGVKLVGDGFIVSRSRLDDVSRRGKAVVKPYLSNKDLVGKSRQSHVIDFFGFVETKAREFNPEAFQQVLELVKPFRMNNREKSRKERWWLFGRSNAEMRESLVKLERYIATPEVAKHRPFVFVSVETIPDASLYCVALSDGWYLGVLSSSIHRVWALRAGGTLEDRPRYHNTRCFDPFAFPFPGELLRAKIRTAAEELDTFRKQRQKEHPDLTLTQMYNVLEKLKANAPLDEDDEAIKDKGLILILKELHERLDRLVFEAYGWPLTLTDEQILERLVALNQERAAEERRGHVRWLRPDYQVPRFGKKLDKQAAKEEGAQVAADLGLPEPGRKPSFPGDSVGQTAAVFAALAAATAPLDAATIARSFRQGKRAEKQIAAVLMSLARLGHVAPVNGGEKFEIRRVA